ncbi:hypothetical protein LV82_01033 [Albidovulum inexpectatum]|uniref:DUF5337 domain-containing protein n=1 Tax=Albidovulum inexpectatum TaxID=196587 RepID=A0A2S5JJX9_9RHOB|nr:DUF5337 domain-containing protein [Albidovulum inexpectatum]PPB81816.1 hypothetical protein LV82_01033 [Albidovulum inexpectatum]
MTTPSEQNKALACQGRLVAVVIAATMVIWLAAQWIGGQAGWQPRYAFLFDMAAIAAFIWALAVTWRIWRRQRRPLGNEDK